MDVSAFLGRLLGLSFIIIGIAMVLRREDFENSIQEIGKNDALMTFISFLPLVIGLAILLGHNIWDSWAIVITLIGWIMAVVGFVRLFFHKEVMQKFLDIVNHPNRIIVSGTVLLILGLYLTILGFWA